MIGRTLVTFGLMLVLVVIEASGVRPARAHAQVPLSSGVLTGQVVEGTNRTPVPFALIELRPANTASEVPGLRRTARTDETGAFTIHGLPPQSFYLSAYKPGYPMTFYGSKASVTTQPGDPIAISPGAVPVKIEIHMLAGGVIAGRVTNQFGQPEPGAQMTLRRLPLSAPVRQPVFYPTPGGTFRTDANGEYRLFELTEGEYLVGAQKANNADVHVGSTTAPPSSFASVFYPGVTDMGVARPVSVRAGTETSGIDIQLRVVTLYRLSGSVDAPKGTSLAMALLRQPGNESLQISYANLAGTFERDRVLPGRYRLTAYTRGSVTPGQPSTPLTWTSMDVTITDRNITDLVVSLQPSMTASGRFITDAPLATRAGVMFRSVGRPLIDASPRPGIISADGEFVVSDLIPGTYTIVVYANNNAIPPITATLNGQPLENNQIEITAGTNITGLELRIRK